MHLFHLGTFSVKFVDPAAQLVNAIHAGSSSPGRGFARRGKVIVVGGLHGKAEYTSWQKPNHTVIDLVWIGGNAASLRLYSFWRQRGIPGVISSNEGSKVNRESPVSISNFHEGGKDLEWCNGKGISGSSNSWRDK